MLYNRSNEQGQGAAIVGILLLILVVIIALAVLAAPLMNNVWQSACNLSPDCKW